MLKDSEDGYKYKHRSHKKVWFVCPNCGKEHYKAINLVADNGLCCSCTSTIVSYAEKFLMSILIQANIEYDYQYSPEWANLYRYDFKLYDKPIDIVELDGYLGHGNVTYLGEKDILGLQRDMIKEKIASDHNEYLIRIDCNYNDMNKRHNYIKNSIVNSELQKIIDFSKIDFDEADRFALNDILHEIVFLWNRGICKYEDIRSHIKLSKKTIKRYLKNASKHGLLDQKYKEKEIFLYVKTCDTPVKCNETGEIFKSLKDVCNKYGASIKRYFIDKLAYAGVLPDGTKLTWKKLEKI